MFSSSMPVREMKASMEQMPSSSSSSCCAPSPQITTAPGSFSLISWQRWWSRSMIFTLVPLASSMRAR